VTVLLSPRCVYLYHIVFLADAPFLHSFSLLSPVVCARAPILTPPPAIDAYQASSMNQSACPLSFIHHVVRKEQHQRQNVTLGGLALLQIPYDNFGTVILPREKER
jgi:hypothetical protein